MTLYALTQDIFEPGVGDAYPVVRHIFYGKTEKEARGYYDAHLTTDAFMRDCTEKGQWEQVQCKTIEAKGEISHVPSIIGAICISPSQRKLHTAAETLALFLVVPFMAYLAQSKRLPGWARATAGLVGLSTLVVDGYLLYRYIRA